MKISVKIKIAKRYELVPLDKIVPYSRNSRIHTKEQIAQIRASFREFGILSPCLVDEDYNLLCGHGRLLAAQAENLSEINCVVVEGLTAAQKKAFIITDNKIGDNSTWDSELLALEFADLKDLGFDLELTGFDPSEIEKLFSAGDGDVQDDDFDLTAALEEAAFVLPGDVWSMARHRLMCGDSTNSDDVARLMDGKLANCVLTDPPYGILYQKSKVGTIKNDELQGEKLYQFLLSSFAQMEKSMANDASIYVFHADTEGLNFRRAFDDAGFKMAACCIWNKNAATFGRSNWKWKHEPCLFGWKKSGKHIWHGDQKQVTVWDCDKPTKSMMHPTQKPIPILAIPLRNSTVTNSIVFDPFAGSASTLICCEQMGRICFTMELDERYASASVKRFVNEYGSENVTVERSGKIYRYADLAEGVSDVKD